MWRVAEVRVCWVTLTSFSCSAEPNDLGDLEHVRDVIRVYEFVLSGEVSEVSEGEGDLSLSFSFSDLRKPHAVRAGRKVKNFFFSFFFFFEHAPESSSESQPPRCPSPSRQWTLPRPT